MKAPYNLFVTSLATALGIGIGSLIYFTMLWQGWTKPITRSEAITIVAFSFVVSWFAPFKRRR